jgi:hypothetical protein
MKKSIPTKKLNMDGVLSYMDIEGLHVCSGSSESLAYIMGFQNALCEEATEHFGNALREEFEQTCYIACLCPSGWERIDAAARVNLAEKRLPILRREWVTEQNRATTVWSPPVSMMQFPIE